MGTGFKPSQFRCSDHSSPVFTMCWSLLIPLMQITFHSTLEHKIRHLRNYCLHIIPNRSKFSIKFLLQFIFWSVKLCSTRLHEQLKKPKNLNRHWLYIENDKCLRKIWQPFLCLVIHPHRESRVHTDSDGVSRLEGHLVQKYRWEEQNWKLHQLS